MSDLNVSRALFSALVLAGSATSLCHADVFDIAAGNVVTLSSAYIFPPERMFGVVGPDPNVESTSCIFSDASPPGYTDFVEFMTPEEVPLTGIRVGVGSDGFVTPLRDVKRITLRADLNHDGSYEKEIFSYEVISTATEIIDPLRTFPMVVADRFRAEFVRGNTPASNGPRIVEFDAIVQENPDRPTVNLISPVGPVTESFTEGGTLALEAVAEDASNGINRVDFYAVRTDGGGEERILIESDKTAPYTATWKNLTKGTYLLQAKAVDQLGAAEFSPEVVQIKVRPTVTTKTLLTPGFLNESQFQFEIVGLKFGETYFVESSVDLVRWEQIFAKDAEADREPFIVEPVDRNRFYRVRQGEVETP